MTRGGEVVKMRGRKYSSQMREFSDYEDSKVELSIDIQLNILKYKIFALQGGNNDGQARHEHAEEDIHCDVE